jgi:DnaJ-class molecular chaperone
MSGPFESPEKKPERPPGREKPKPCRACKGTGYLKGKTCKYCGGSGVDNPNAEG